jgi:HEAT repeat protein
MPLPRFRFHIRALLLIVTLVAVCLLGLRIYFDGPPEAHWLALKLRYGNILARRAAAADAWQGGEAWDGFFDGANRAASEMQRQRRQRRAEMLLPALVQATKDSDAVCRARALRSLHNLATLDGSEHQENLALRHILAATRDLDGYVRAAAVDSMVGLASRDTGAVISAFRSALADPSVTVRLTATQQLGMLGVIVPQTQPDVALILIPLLASEQDARVRAKAAWALCYFGVDRRRHPPNLGPDVAPALVAALHDPDVDVRRTAAHILGLTVNTQGGGISSWDQRKESIIPALRAAIADDDKETRENSALALFALGQREPVVIELIEQAARDPARFRRAEFEPH